jgi:predicted cupin superfamily sugar epimerase
MDNADSTIIKQLIDKFNLLPHPEGGYYAETYRSDCIVTVTETSSVVSLNASTAIYFLVLPSTVSRLHRIKWDEMWHFYLGGPLVVVELVNGRY